MHEHDLCPGSANNQFMNPAIKATRLLALDLRLAAMDSPERTASATVGCTTVTVQLSAATARYSRETWLLNGNRTTLADLRKALIALV